MEHLHKRGIVLAEVLVVCLLLNIPSARSAERIYARTISYFLVRCSGFTTEPTCTAGGCYWWDSACHSLPGTVETDMCFIIDEEITLCVTELGTMYIILNTGFYGEIIDV